VNLARFVGYLYIDLLHLCSLARSLLLSTIWSLISEPATAPQVSHDYWKIGRNLYYKHRLCIPAGQQREDAIRQLHEHHLTGHGSTQPTTILARRSLYWSDLEKDVDDFCLTCDQCQRAKALTRKPYGHSVPTLARVTLDRQSHHNGMECLRFCERAILLLIFNLRFFKWGAVRAS
jgi:hypothetical protein